MKISRAMYLFLFLFSGITLASSQAQMTDEGMYKTDPQTTVATVDNKVCPVTGRKIPKEDIGKYAVEYQGKIYNLCSASCKDEFMKDPDTYAARAQESAVKTDAETAEETGAMPDNLNGMEDGPLMDETDNGPAA